ncbi:MAG TPA: Ivy family c-type lysozyme inhibitor [Burkholderiaceae bacterium]|nr:Ivy family c-type lysozyme inhibitor [Burkholderiaceae bacterium]
MKSLQFFAAALLLISPQLSAADEPKHLYEATQADPALKKAFAELVKPVAKDAPWLSNYGTTAPPVDKTLDDTSYQIYWGCKPKDCIRESYTVVYNPKTQEMVAGAFVRNEFDGPMVKNSQTTWLGKTDWDFAKFIGPYLY